MLTFVTDELSIAKPNPANYCAGLLPPPVKEVTAAEGSTAPGRQWLRTELGDRYWQNRKTILEVLKYLARLEHTLALAPRRRQRPPARRGGGE